MPELTRGERARKSERRKGARKTIAVRTRGEQRRRRVCCRRSCGERCWETPLQTKGEGAKEEKNENMGDDVHAHAAQRRQRCRRSTAEDGRCAHRQRAAHSARQRAAQSERGGKEEEQGHTSLFGWKQTVFFCVA